MTAAIQHISEHRIDGSELHVVAEVGSGVESLIGAEIKVAQRFLARAAWPHKRVNLFVFRSLEPLVERLSLYPMLSASAVRRLDRRPMVHIYNEQELSECSLFVNQGLLARQGLWTDELALQGLLAHEHAHPMAENTSVRAARRLDARLIDIDIAARRAPRAAPLVRWAVASSLDAMAQDLCKEGPHHLFSGEFAILAGFEPALRHLCQLSLAQGRSGMTERANLSEGLRADVHRGRLTREEMELLVLTAAMEAHLPLALETAAFAKGGRIETARCLEELAEAEVFRHVEEEVGALYRGLFAAYLELEPDLEPLALRDWARALFQPLIELFAVHGAPFSAEFHYQKETL